MFKIRVSTVLRRKRAEKTIPRIAIANTWLNAMGFPSDTIVSVEKCGCGYGHLMLKACGQGMEAYKLLVQEIRRTGARLVQVRNVSFYGEQGPLLELSGLWLEQWGFPIGEPVAIGYEYGTIYLKRINPDIFGV